VSAPDLKASSPGGEFVTAAHYVTGMDVIGSHLPRIISRAGYHRQQKHSEVWACRTHLV
jgi:hypothetical protein